ncbi:hypothetical protein JCM8097_007624 [Rhodosporidiobolus ruineniae]
MDQQEAQVRLAQMGVFVLSGLSKGSEFGLDGKMWQVDAFSGVKFLPPGLHFFVFSAAPSAAQQAHLGADNSSGGGVGVRHGILRFFLGGERVVEEWDNAREELKRDGTARSSKRRRVVEGRQEAEETVVSDDYLKSLDKQLAPYPVEDLASTWSALTGFITEQTLARVVGLDSHACGLVDALTASSMDEHGAGPDGVAATAGASARRTWGKEREDEPQIREVVDEEEEEGAEPEAYVPEDRLEFVRFEEKRSWPKGAVGEELTRWSKDKSWQLSEVVRDQLGDDPKELLAELQLSFILFSLLHNFSSLTVYKALFSLLCRSSTLAHPPSSRSSTTLPSPTLNSASLPLFASFLALFHAQLAFLPDDFFTTQLPSLEQHLLDSLAALSNALSDALPAWTAAGETDAAIAEVWKEVIKRWDALAQLAMGKFGWDLGVVKGSRARYTVAEGRAKREEDEVDLEDLEEGEDAPVIMDEEGLYINSDDY